jgi:hypothetical protein
MCRFFEQGFCNKGYNCSFAHDASELQQRPNFYKTQLCSTFQRNGKCRDGVNCNYAHGRNELRQVANPQPAFPKLVYVQVMQEMFVPMQMPVAGECEAQYDSPAAPPGTFISADFNDGNASDIHSQELRKTEEQQDFCSSQTTDDGDSSSKFSDDSWSRFTFDDDIEDSRQFTPTSSLRAQPSSIWAESPSFDVGLSVKKTFLHCDLHIGNTRRRSVSCSR